MKSIFTTLLLLLVSLAASAGTLVVPPAGIEGKAYYAAAYSYAKGDNRSFNINIARDGDAIYIQGLYPELPEAWMAGTMHSDNVAIFPSGQFLGTVRPEQVDDSHEVFDVYFYCSTDLNKAIDFELSYNPANDTYEATYQYLLFSEKDNIRARFEHMQNLNVFSGAHVQTAKPANLPTTPYRLHGYECSLGKNLDYPVEVGFEGDDVYVRGISEVFPDVWVRGVREPAGKNFEIVRFMRNQYLGPYTLGSTTYDIWLTGIDHDNAYFTDVIFYLDPSTGVFSQQEGNWLVVNGDPVQWHWLNNMSDVTMEPDEGGADDGGDVMALVVPPAGLTTTTFRVSGYDCSFGTPEAIAGYDVELGIGASASGQEIEVYVCGLFTDIPDAWVKGTMALTPDGTPASLTFASPQYLGKWYDSLDCWFMGVDASEQMASLTFTYDAALGAFVQQEGTFAYFNDTATAPSPMALQMLAGLVLQSDCGAVLNGIRHSPNPRGPRSVYDLAGHNVGAAAQQGIVVANHRKMLKK